MLEIGAGPGRFTLELAHLGARVVVTDVSSVQLDLNAQYVRDLGGEFAVEERQLLDIRDAAALGDAGFDVVTAFGGPLSYVFEDAPAALTQMLRVVKPGRPVLASVMSTLGAWRALLGPVLDDADRGGDDAMERALRTGDLRPTQTSGHVAQMYRWSELRAFVAQCDAEVVAASASNWASLGDPAEVERVTADPQRWNVFLEQEITACREPGALDGGTHLLFRRRSPWLSPPELPMSE